MVRLASEVLGRLGRRPHPRAPALSCPSLAVGGPGGLSRVNPRPVVRRYCPWPRFVDGPPSSAALALRPSALRRSVGDASMTTSGGPSTRYSYNPPVLGAPASIIGSEPILGQEAPTLRFARLCIARGLGWCHHDL